LPTVFFGIGNMGDTTSRYSQATLPAMANPPNKTLVFIINLIFPTLWQHARFSDLARPLIAWFTIKTCKKKKKRTWQNLSPKKRKNPFLS
jgi:hypothetical protein